MKLLDSKCFLNFGVIPKFPKMLRLLISFGSNPNNANLYFQNFL